MRREYIYREKENSEILKKRKPRGIGREEIVRRWEVIRKIMRGRRWLKRKIGWLFKLNGEIMGVFYREKGIRKRKTKRLEMGLGR